MTTILLTRHGHIDNPAQLFYGPDVHLSDKGKRQILALARDMKEAGVSPSRLISSPHVRTQESSELLATILGIQDVSTDTRLVEWKVDGCLGKPQADFYAYTNYLKDPAGNLPSDIEPLATAADRVQHLLTDLVQASNNDTILVVSHREPMASAILRYQNKGFEEIHKLHLPVASSWELEFTRMTRPDHLNCRFDRSSLE